MPVRAIVAGELAKIFNVLSHPHRILIVEELGIEERDVNYLVATLNISQPRVSQHLSILRSHNIIGERKEGRKAFYHLIQGDLAKWLLDGLVFIKNDVERKESFISVVEKAESLWGKHLAK